MAYDQQPGTAELRKTYVDEFVKGYALQNYKFKQALRVKSTDSWNNEFFRESPSDLTAGGKRNVKGIPRGGSFPQAFVKWDKLKSTIRKYGLEQSVPWEDSISSEINVDERVLLRISRGVVKSVDDGIYSTLTSDTDIISFSASNKWDTTDAIPLDDLEEAEQKIAENNYDTSNLWVYVSPKAKRYVMKYLVENGNKLQAITDQKTTNANGKIGTIGNKTFIVSNSVEDSKCIVLVPKMVGEWKELMPLTTAVITEPMKDTLVRAAELGQTQITDPKTAAVIDTIL